MIRNAGVESGVYLAPDGFSIARSTDDMTRREAEDKAC